MTNVPLLLIDDDESITTPLRSFLKAKGYAVTVANDGEDALEQLRCSQFPFVVTDIYIDRVTGLDILRAAKAANPACQVIMMTARGSVGTAVESEAGGAFEYLAKPFEMRQLLEVLERAARAAAPAAPPAEEDLEGFGAIVGFSPAMVQVYTRIARCAKNDDIVLISGETGVGKELVARAIHDHGARAARPFIAVDCGAIPGTLWESEMFGSVRGGFTGSDRDRPGVVETARGGTVFLDEIGEIPPEFQPKLLRFLQEREYRPVGAGAPRRADVRVIAATNRPLEQMARQGVFREDLFYRLNVLRIDVPPLRQRTTDIPFLTRRFLEKSVPEGRIWLEPEALAALERYDWPGNVRQLQNIIRQLAAYQPAGPVTGADVVELLGTNEGLPEDEPMELSERERQQILRVLAETGGNKTRAAEILGIQRRTLYKKLARMEREAAGHSAAPEPSEPPACE